MVNYLKSAIPSNTNTNTKTNFILKHFFTCNTEGKNYQFRETAKEKKKHKKKVPFQILSSHTTHRSNNTFQDNVLQKKYQHNPYYHSHPHFVKYQNFYTCNETLISL